MLASEVEFSCRGRHLAGKRWQGAGAHRVIALHGWLDNANSFDLIAPALPELDIVALDFAGHGKSEHRRPDTPYLAMLDVQDVVAVALELEWDTFSMIGHSMGAEIGTHVVSLFPEMVDRFVAIDGFAESIGHEKWLEMHRTSIHANLTRAPSRLRVYPNLTVMAETVAKSTGQTVASARVLLERGAKAVDGGFTWASDPRVRWSDALGITFEQMEHNLSAYNGAILVVGANDGLQWFRDDLDRLMSRCANLTFVEIDGSHHVHMDDDRDELLRLLRGFFSLP